MPRNNLRRSPYTVALLLKGLKFPASRDDVMVFAEEEYTPQEIIDILEQIPDRNYLNMSEVVSAISLTQTTTYQS